MTHFKQTLAAKKAVFTRILTQVSSWRLFLLFALLLFTTILFVHLRQPPAIAASEVTATKAVLPAAAKLPAPSQAVPKTDTKLATAPSIWPAHGAVTSGFGWRISPFGDGNELHAGIDISYPTGAPVVATADGEVAASGPVGGYGNLVQIDHGNGISTFYGHNSQLAVTAGQQVKKGQVIAYAGSTGRSTGSHVHYEVRVNNNPIDPMKYLILY